MKIIFSPKCLEYDSPGHPESSERVRSVYELLKRKKFEFVEPEVCSENDLLKVHSRELVERIKSGNFRDFETPNLPNIFYYARLAVGGALKAKDFALGNETSFSLMRPPGHHAGKSSCEGFCYFNNLAIAVTKALDFVKRVAILDIDAHHGNGSQNIFFGSKRVIYVSLHQFGFIYPGTGGYSEGNCYNYPLPPNTNESVYLENLKSGIERIRDFEPDLLGISAGFDTYKEDPLTNMNLEIETYGKIARMIKKMGIRRFAVLEGGYSKRLPECVFEFLKNL
jgi:acetoin utilization deacetylase AcuC-like enzyme